MSPLFSNHDNYFISWKLLNEVSPVAGIITTCKHRWRQGLHMLSLLFRVVHIFTLDLAWRGQKEVAMQASFSPWWESHSYGRTSCWLWEEMDRRCKANNSCTGRALPIRGTVAAMYGKLAGIESTINTVAKASHEARVQQGLHTAHVTIFLKLLP